MNILCKYLKSSQEEHITLPQNYLTGFKVPSYEKVGEKKELQRYKSRRKSRKNVGFLWQRIGGFGYIQTFIRGIIKHHMLSLSSLMLQQRVK